MKTVRLNSGYEMPMVGLGTWQIKDEEKVEETLRNAIKVGYRHIDTALIYENEKCIGKALKKMFNEGVIKREELFITSKLWNTYHDDPEEGIKTSLRDLQLEYLDLYLVHWPVKFKTENFRSVLNSEGENVLEKYDCIKLWKDMESLVSKGYCKSIGVANHGISNLSLILEKCKIKPAINQVEIHPYLNQEELVDFCHKNNINVVSYTSLGGSTPNKVNLKEDGELLNLTRKYKKTVPQVILSWLVMRNILVIPKSSSIEHLTENYELINLDKEDFKDIERLNRNFRFVDPVNWGPERFN